MLLLPWMSKSTSDIPDTETKVKVKPHMEHHARPKSTTRYFKRIHHGEATVQVIAITPVTHKPGKLKTRRGRVSAAESVLKTLLYGDTTRQHQLKRDLTHEDKARKILHAVKGIPRRCTSKEEILPARAVCLVAPELHRCQHAQSQSNRASVVSMDQTEDPGIPLPSAVDFVNLYTLASDPTRAIAAFAGRQGAYDALAAVAGLLLDGNGVSAAPKDRMTCFICALRASSVILVD
jgi:hypothetical protein